MTRTDSPIARAFNDLVGQAIVSITFVHDYCQVEIENSSRLTLLAAPTLVCAGEAVNFLEPAFADQLRRQVGHRFVRIEHVPDESIVLTVDGGTQLAVSMNGDVTGPERGTLTTADGPIIVW